MLVPVPSGLLMVLSVRRDSALRPHPTDQDGLYSAKLRRQAANMPVSLGIRAKQFAFEVWAAHFGMRALICQCVSITRAVNVHTQ